jgi:NarL family two-component system response regulator LiaR
MSDQSVRIMIVDDHETVRRGLSIFLEAHLGFELVAEAGDGVQAVALCEKFQPDVVLMDIMMPEMDGVSATSAILAKFPHTRIIALTSVRDETMLDNMMKAGAIAQLSKDVTVQELADAISSVLQ